MDTMTPHEDEDALSFVERADALGLSEEVINVVLKRHFDMIDDGEMKALKLKSKPFWQRFYRERVSALHKRGGARYAAVKFVQRKNGQSGQAALSQDEIEKLVDSVGPWLR